MNQDLKKIVQQVNRLSWLYWQPLGFQDQKQIRSLTEDWRHAFIWFLRSFAFERQGRSPHYSDIALKAVRSYKEEQPYHENFEQKIWQNFLSRGRFPDDGKGANTKNNPLSPSKDEICSASALIASLEDYDFNIVKWASLLVASGDVETVWDNLVKIRGIGKKIASFFLRDIVYAFEINEEIIRQKIYLQPIDIWTKRGAEVFAKFISKTPYSYWDYAEIIIEVSEHARVSSTLTNTGLWILGSQLVRDGKQFQEVLLKYDNLLDFLYNQIHFHQNQGKTLEKVLNKPDKIL